jgi:hypothetical protein
MMKHHLVLASLNGTKYVLDNREDMQYDLKSSRSKTTKKPMKISQKFESRYDAKYGKGSRSKMLIKELCTWEKCSWIWFPAFWRHDQKIKTRNPQWHSWTIQKRANVSWHCQRWWRIMNIQVRLWNWSTKPQWTKARLTHRKGKHVRLQG